MTVVSSGMLLKVPHWALLLGQLVPVFPPETIFVPLKSILVNPLPWKAPLKLLFPALIVVTVLGIAIVVKLVQPWKAFWLIVVNPLGS